MKPRTRTNATLLRVSLAATVATCSKGQGADEVKSRAQASKLAADPVLRR
jgi:hypothetical protein